MVTLKWRVWSQMLLFLYSFLRIFFSLYCIRKASVAIPSKLFSHCTLGKCIAYSVINHYEVLFLQKFRKLFELSYRSMSAYLLKESVSKDTNSSKLQYIFYQQQAEILIFRRKYTILDEDEDNKLQSMIAT